MEGLPAKIRNKKKKKKCPILPQPFNIILKVLVNTVRIKDIIAQLSKTLSEK